jgi:hypothetical protein
MHVLQGTHRRRRVRRPVAEQTAPARHLSMVRARSNDEPIDSAPTQPAANADRSGLGSGSVTTGPSREQVVSGRLFLTGHEDRVTPRPRRSPEGRVRESSTLPNCPQSAGAARRMTGRLCASAHLSQDASDRAVLLTSELVTNAFLHSRGTQRLTVTTRSDGVRVEVGDDSRELPVLRPQDDEALEGRGVQLLELCASSWGARPTARGKCVWFEIRSAPEPPSADPDCDQDHGADVEMQKSCRSASSAALRLGERDRELQ